MNKQSPIPDNADPMTVRIVSLFNQLSDNRKAQALSFAEAVVSGDMDTAHQIKKEIETELAYRLRNAEGGAA